MIDFDRWQFHREQTKWSTEADFVEARALEYGEFPFDGGHVDEIATGQFVEDQSEHESAGHLPIRLAEPVEEGIRRKLTEQLESKQRAHLRREDLSAGVQAELWRRQSLMGSAYPFNIKNGSLELSNNETRSSKIYAQLLKTSVDAERADRELFEGTVAAALCAYLGKEKAKHMCFGWRSCPEEEQPRRIKQRIELLHTNSGEWKWNTDEKFPDDPTPKMAKDLGLDVVAWLPMPDSRMGQIFAVAQCATGNTDWEGKFHDVSWKRLENWIRPLPSEWSVRCFAVPFHIPNNARWQEVSGDAGFLLDRARLTLLLR
jgi:hypothetical protein